MKLPYEYVAREVDKLYEKEFSEDDVTSIDKHIEFIVAFINAAGWDELEFMDLECERRNNMQRLLNEQTN